MSAPDSTSKIMRGPRLAEALVVGGVTLVIVHPLRFLPVSEPQSFSDGSVMLARVIDRHNGERL